jgi:hypothetical protein
MNSGEDFVGSQEVCRMEHGGSFGLSRIAYWRIASATLAAEKYGGIEPCSISKLPDEEGARLELYGKKMMFIITARPNRSLICLSALPLDTENQKPVELFSGCLNNDNDFGRLTDIILRTDGLAEGWRRVSYEELVAFNKKQNETGWMLGGSI